MRILVVEDEKALATGLKRGLEAEGFAVDIALDGPDGLWLARENAYDAIILDIMLPEVNGFQVCSTLRDEKNWTPILMLTAKDGELDEAEALDSGADDYLTKPFSYVVLLARIRALLRRDARERPAVLEAGDLKLDTASHRCWRQEEEVSLTPREFSLLDTCCGTRARRSPRPRSWPTSGTSTSRVTPTSLRSRPPPAGETRSALRSQHAANGPRFGLPPGCRRWVDHWAGRGTRCGPGQPPVLWWRSG